MTYRNKYCPKCNTEHKKRGPYCSKSCSNSMRIITKEQKANQSEGMRKFLNGNSDKAEELRWNINNYDQDEKGTDPVAPQSPTLPPNQFVQGGDLWSEDDSW